MSGRWLLVLLIELSFLVKGKIFCSWALGFKGKKGKSLAAIVGAASILWTICNVRNGGCFRNTILVDPISIVAIISHYNHFWASLQKKIFKNKHCGGAQTMSALCFASHNKKKKNAPCFCSVMHHSTTEECTWWRL
jgi:hypothetical protein